MPRIFWKKSAQKYQSTKMLQGRRPPAAGGSLGPPRQAGAHQFWRLEVTRVVMAQRERQSPTFSREIGPPALLRTARFSPARFRSPESAVSLHTRAYPSLQTSQLMRRGLAPSARRLLTPGRRDAQRPATPRAAPAQQPHAQQQPPCGDQIASTWPMHCPTALPSPPPSP